MKSRVFQTPKGYVGEVYEENGGDMAFRSAPLSSSAAAVQEIAKFLASKAPKIPPKQLSSPLQSKNTTQVVQTTRRCCGK